MFLTLKKYINYNLLSSLPILILLIMIFIGTLFAEIDCFYDTTLTGKWNILYGITTLILVFVILNIKQVSIDYILLLCYSIYTLFVGVNDVSLKIISLFILCKAFSNMSREVIKILYFIIPIIISILSFLGIMQFAENYEFNVSVCFDNPVGFAVANVCGFVFALYSYKINIGYKKIISLLCILLTIAGIVISGSRSALFASIVAVVLFFDFKDLFYKQRTCIKIAILFLIIIILGVFFFVKINSSYGRIFIWKCCIEMISDYPIFGSGHESFIKNYMLYQAEFFNQNSNSIFTSFADNVLFPYNEYLSILINYGIFGLLILIGFCYYIIKIYVKNKNIYTTCAFTGLITIAVFSLFSYPFRYPFTWVFTTLCISILLQSVRNSWKIKNDFLKNSIKILLLLYSLFLLFNIYRTINSEINWLKLSDSIMFDNRIIVDQNYVEIFEELKDNQYFLYDYAEKMYEMDSCSKSLQIVSILKQYRNSYDIEILQAQNYFKLKKYDEAIIHFKIASMMIPNRIIPIYGIFLSYKEKGDTLMANKMAKSIVAFKPKILNGDVYRIKKECERYKSDN